MATVLLDGSPVDERGHNFMRGKNARGFVNLREKTPLEVAHPHIINAFECATCGAYPALAISEDSQGRYTLAAKSDCKLPEGLDITFDFPVTSGRVVVSDRLGIFDPETPSDFNADSGKACFTELMLAEGSAWGYVGNTSPDLLRVGDGRYVIASRDLYAEPGEEGYLAGEQLAHITTDVWSFEIVDYDDYRARADLYDGDRMIPGLTVVDLPVGTYRFRVHTARADYDPHDRNPAVHAEIEYLGPTTAVEAAVQATPAKPRHMR